MGGEDQHTFTTARLPSSTAAIETPAKAANKIDLNNIF